MNYLQVKNWSEFQHYKDRTPPWIKLHRELLRDYTFTCLQDASKAHLMSIWLLASQLDNRIPMDIPWIEKQIGATEPLDLNVLISSGFLYCSEPLAERKQNAMPEAEAYKEETENPKGAKKKAAVIEIPGWIDPELWLEFEQHRKEIKAKLTPTATKRLIANLDKHRKQGADPNEAIRASIENQWRGVFPERLLEKQNGRTNQTRKSTVQQRNERNREAFLRAGG